MASPILIPKKSTIADKVPLPEQLAGGEVSVNWADQVWHGKHPSTNAVIPIGAPSIHSHDELYSLDKSQHIELQNNGSLVLNGSTTLTLPSASATIATLSDISAKVGSVTTGIANTTPIVNMMQITLAGYNALGVNVVTNTLYIIVG